MGKPWFGRCNGSRLQQLALIPAVRQGPEPWPWALTFVLLGWLRGHPISVLELWSLSLIRQATRRAREAMRASTGPESVRGRAAAPEQDLKDRMGGRTVSVETQTAGSPLNLGAREPSESGPPALHRPPGIGEMCYTRKCVGSGAGQKQAGDEHEEAPLPETQHTWKNKFWKLDVKHSAL